MKASVQAARLVALLTPAWLLPAQMLAQAPAAINEPNAAIVAIFHAEGAQIYECSPDANGKLVWRMREPIATLVDHGNTVGRHYADGGPNWEHVDGSALRGKAVASAPGATSDDIPWLKLDVTAHRREGKLTGANVVQRINTKGGVATGSCDEAGSFRSAPYSADYVFLRKD